MANVIIEGREIGDDSMCDFSGEKCSELSSEEIKELIKEPGEFPKNCPYMGKLNNGDHCDGACSLRDYSVEVTEAAKIFKRKRDNGELDFED